MAKAMVIGIALILIVFIIGDQIIHMIKSEEFGRSPHTMIATNQLVTPIIDQTPIVSFTTACTTLNTVTVSIAEYDHLVN